jgi:hypothetical protein
MTGGGRGALVWEKWRNEGGVLPSESKAFIADDEDGLTWFHSSASQPPVTSGLGGDGAAHPVVHKAYPRRLRGGDPSRLNGSDCSYDQPSPLIETENFQFIKWLKF